MPRCRCIVVALVAEESPPAMAARPYTAVVRCAARGCDSRRAGPGDPYREYLTRVRLPAQQSPAETYVVPYGREHSASFDERPEPARVGRARASTTTGIRFAPDVTHGARAHLLLADLLVDARRPSAGVQRAKAGRFRCNSSISRRSLSTLSFNVATYPAIYLWSQPRDTVNVTPEWVTSSMP